MDVKFVGRKEELAELQSYVNSKRNLVYCLFSDMGGVGKTSLALELKRIANKGEQVTPLYLDFDDVENRQLGTIEKKIVETFGSHEDLARYTQAVKALRTAREDENENLAMDRKNECLISAYTTHPKRFLVIFDTFERIQNSISLIEILNLINRLAGHGMVLICGRLTDSFRGKLRFNEYVEKQIGPLSDEATYEYLRDKKDFKISDEILKKLGILSQKPLILDLALLWISPILTSTGLLKPSSRRPSQSIIELPLEELKKDPAKYQTIFEREIINGVMNLSTPLDHAIIYMSLINFPFDEVAIEYILGRQLRKNKREPESMRRDLNGLFFVRSNLVLHEEMKRLIKEYTWPLVGREALQEEFYADLHKFIKKQKSTSSDGEARFDWELQEFILNFEIRPKNEAISFAEKLIKVNTKKTNEDNPIFITRRKRIFDIWKRYDEDSITEEYFVWLLDLGGFSDEEIARYILKSAELSPVNQILALLNIASDIRDEKPSSALSLYNRVREIAHEINRMDLEASLLNNMGMCYRRMAKFTDAKKAFDESIKICQKNKNKSVLASALNNLAYVNRELGHIGDAMHQARMALQHRESLNEVLGVAYSKMTLGELYMDQSRFDTAQDNFDEAFVVFKEKGKLAETALIKILLAKTNRSTHRPSDADKYIEEAFAIIEGVGDEILLATAKNECGCELRKRARELSKAGHFDEATKCFAESEKMFKESIQSVRSSEDVTKLVDNLSDLTLVYRYWHENQYLSIKNGNKVDLEYTPDKLFNLAHKAAKSAIAVCRTHDELSLYESRAFESLGDLAYAQAALKVQRYKDPKKDKEWQERQFFRAFARYYLPACLLLSDYYSSLITRYSRVFDRIHKKIINKDVSPKIVSFTAAYLSRRWKEEGRDKVAPEFIEIYSDIAENWNIGR